MNVPCANSLPESSLQDEIKRFNPSLPIEKAIRPPASWYVRQEILDLEKKQIFQPSYQVVGTLDQLSEEGCYFTGRFMGWPYVVVRQDADNIRAFYNVCSHHGSCVAQNEGRTAQFECPYHGWTYDLTGKLRKAPHAGNIVHFHKQGLNLKPIPTRCYGRFIVLRFGEPKTDPALETALQALAALDAPDLQAVYRKTYAIACNWKVFIDNYLDGGYHVAHLHKDLSAQLDLDDYASSLFEAHVIQRCKAKPGNHERYGDLAQYLWLYPNFCANRYGPWLDTNWVIPTGPQSCDVSFAYFHLGPVAKETIKSLLQPSDQVQQEDMFICEQVQQGLQSGVYRQGIYAPKFEKPMHLFHKRLAAQLATPS